MDEDYIVNRGIVYGLEFVKSEMELKVTEMLRKNPKFDVSDAMLKIKAINDAENYVYALFEELNKIKKLNYRLDLENKILISKELLTKR